MTSSIDTSVVWPVLLILADNVMAAQAADTTGTVYVKKAHTRVDQSQEFHLERGQYGRTSCVMACATHEQCQSVNIRSDTSECMGTSKTYYSFGASASTESGMENFSPQATEVRDGDWILVFRAQKDVDHSSADRLFYEAWNNDSLRSDDDLSTLHHDCYSSSAGTCAHFFRSRLMADWPDDVRQVRLALYTGGSLEAEVVFDGVGSSRDNWFNASRLVSSTWGDLTSADAQLSINGVDIQHRMFMAIHTSTVDEYTCNQVGWFLVEVQKGNLCPFDSTVSYDMHGSQPRSPQFLYSSTGAKIDFSDDPVTYGMADVMAVFIKLQ